MVKSTGKGVPKPKPKPKPKPAKPYPILCNGTDPLLLICDILQCFFKITLIVEFLASS